MNDAPIKQPGAPEVEREPAELSAPHFDNVAVLSAQPVEPLPARFSWFAAAIPRIAIVSAFAMVFAVAVAVSALILPAEQTKTSGPSPDSGVQSEQVEAEPLDKMADALSPGSVRDRAAGKPDKDSPLRKAVRSSRFRKMISTGEEGKPQARKVGEIRYGRSQN